MHRATRHFELDDGVHRVHLTTYAQIDLRARTTLVAGAAGDDRAHPRQRGSPLRGGRAHGDRAARGSPNRLGQTFAVELSGHAMWRMKVQVLAEPRAAVAEPQRRSADEHGIVWQDVPAVQAVEHGQHQEFVLNGVPDLPQRRHGVDDRLRPIVKRSHRPSPVPLRQSRPTGQGRYSAPHASSRGRPASAWRRGASPGPVPARRCRQARQSAAGPCV